jgi:hypothetical protein
VDATKRAAYLQVLFVHEHDLIGNLRRFPLISRLRLDQLELVMPLEVWQAFSYETREAIVLDALDDQAQCQALLEKIQAEARRVMGGELERAPPKPMADFEDLSAVPAGIAQQLRRFDVELTTKGWQALSKLARFGLAKLSREGHDNRRLGPLVDDLFFRREAKQQVDPN